VRISRKSIVGACCLIGMFALGFLLRGVVAPDAVRLLPAAQAQADRGPGSHRCSSRTLKGAYGVKFEGVRVGIGPVASVSRLTFDGEGNFTTNEVGRFNGNLVQRTFSGQYTVNEDCTGFLSFPSTLTGPPRDVRGDFVIVDGGQEFFLLDNSDNWVANGVGKRL
jgi:hypothetical protein